MKKNKTILIVGFLVFSVFLAKKFLLQSDEQLILKRMETLSLLLTKNKGQGALVVATKIKQALDLFDLPTKVNIDYEDGFKRTISLQDKQKLKESISSFKFMHKWVIVTFEDTVIEVIEDKATTVGRVRLKFKTKAQGRVYDLYDIKMSWNKANKEWFVKDVDLTPVEQ